jgi:hypothetical protein
MTATTPEEIAAEVAEARAELARKQARADAIREAEQAARRQAELDHYREAYGPKSYEYRELRDTAKAKLDETAAAEPSTCQRFSPRSSHCAKPTRAPTLSPFTARRMTLSTRSHTHPVSHRRRRDAPPALARSTRNRRSGSTSTAS